MYKGCCKSECPILTRLNHATIQVASFTNVVLFGSLIKVISQKVDNVLSFGLKSSSCPNKNHTFRRVSQIGSLVKVMS